MRRVTSQDFAFLYGCFARRLGPGTVVVCGSGGVRNSPGRSRLARFWVTLDYLRAAERFPKKPTADQSCRASLLPFATRRDGTCGPRIAARNSLLPRRIYEFNPHRPIADNCKSEFSLPHSSPGWPRCFPVVPRRHARRGAGAAATNGLAGLARMRNSSCDFAPYAEADMASVTRCGAGRVWHL